MVHGLTRARGFTQDDAHIYCTDEQMQGEIRSLLQFVLDLLRDYGLDDFYLELSTRDPEKSIGSDEDWERATDALREAAEASGLELVLDPGGAAFYAPKISVQAKDAIGRTWQMSTIQVDLMEPDLFGLEYTAADGSRQRPVMIHRALFGSIERFFGILTEHYAGAFPAWLAPVQAVAIPVTDEQCGYVEGVAAALRAQGIRVEVDAGDDRMQKKIRTHTLAKVPFLLLVGARDAEAGAVSFRFRDGTQRNGVPVESAVARWSTGCAGGRTPRRTPRCSALRAACRPRPASSVRCHGLGSGTWWTRWGLRRRRSPRRTREPDTENWARGSRCSNRATASAPRTGSAGSGRRTGWPTSTRRRRRPSGLPVLPDPDPARRGRAGGRPRRDGLRGAEPAPVQPRAPHGGALPARRRAGGARPTPSRRS